MGENDLGIFCFQHCDKSANILCLKLPQKCPLCNADLQTSELRVPPFRIPYPFKSSSQVPCCVVIKPTKGTFLNYSSSLDLHAGVTDSKGVVHEFDKEGLKVGKSADWTQCVAVPIITKQDSSWHEFWDYTLDIVKHQDLWESSRYDEQKHNCYSFVMSFLRMLQIPELKSSVKDKTTFSNDFIVPRTKNAARYITLYRKLQKDGIYVKR